MTEQTATISKPALMALKQSIPMAYVHISLGILYGFLFVDTGNAWYWAPLFSIFVNGIAMQFAALTMICDNAPLLELTFALLPLAIRNSFYGLSLFDRFKGHPLLRAYLAFNLVDLTYSTFLNGPRYEGKEDQKYCFTLTTLSHLYLIGGTLFGALVGTKLNLPPGMSFALTAIFVVIAIDQLIKVKTLKPVLIATISCVAAMIFFPTYKLLAAFILALVLCVFFPIQQKTTT